MGNNLSDDTTTSSIKIYSDGACRGNPGPGGWGVLLCWNHHKRQLYGGELYTTNNRMELRAAIEGLSALTRFFHVDITTDSEYVRRGVTEWLQRWKQNGWKTSNKKPVKNVDLWKILDALTNKHQVSWHWVRGHSGHHENEIADALANRGIDELDK